MLKLDRLLSLVASRRYLAAEYGLDLTRQQFLEAVEDRVLPPPEFSEINGWRQSALDESIGKFHGGGR